ncbi:MAG: protein phosphatase 2C domain-containing protein [Chloroflexi bacterium]|nr:protein phosphatase 2C domain-containing protein [Chloroflexota bacterium]
MLKRIIGWFRGRDEDQGPEPDLADTAPLSPDNLDQIPGAKIRESLEAGSAQSVGLERENNEDSVFVMYGTSYGEEPLPEFGLFCVADGAGGLGHGELASSIALKAVVSSLMENAVLKALQLDEADTVPSIEDIARQAMEHANEEVIESANGGVTTLTVAMILNGQMVIGHVGDSRAYLVENGKPRVLTRDHSYSWRLVEIGQITPEEAMEHPKRNQLWNAVGQGNNLVIEVDTYPQPHGGYLLLCSDGLWGEVPENELSSVVTLYEEPNEACEELVRAANAAGGPDNITALLVAFPGI